MEECCEEELGSWKKREEQISRFLKETKYLLLPNDIERDLREKLNEELSVCIEQEEQILNSELAN